MSSSECTFTATQFDFLNNMVAIRLQFDAPQIENDVSRNAQSHTYIVIDNSGSMSGRSIDMAREGTQALVAECRRNDPRADITLFVFNSDTTVHELPHTASDAKCDSIVRGIHACGGTDFTNMFTHVYSHLTQKLIKTKPHVDLTLVLMSDGCDWAPRGTSARDKLQANIAACARAHCASFHTYVIGLSSGHDAKLLGNIAQMGSDATACMFVYAETPAVVSDTLKNASSTVGARVRGASLSLGASPQSHSVMLEPVEQDTTSDAYVGYLLLKKDDAHSDVSATLSVTLSDADTPVSLTQRVTLAADTPDMSTMLDMLCTYVGAEIMAATQRVTSKKLTKAELTATNAHVQSLQTTIEKTITKVRSTMRPVARKHILTRCYALLGNLGNFMTVFRESFFTAKGTPRANAGSLSNDQLAKLNSLAYRGITKRSLQKKLDVRAVANADKMANMDAKAERYVQSLDLDAVDVPDIGACFLSTNTAKEALADVDYMCLALKLTRSEACVADPSLVRIVDVWPSFMTGESFLESVEFANENTPSVNDGAFDRQATSVIDGVSREPITAVLPLYVCEEHWKVARLKGGFTLGYAATLDPLGYAYQQWVTLPFLVMAHLVTKRAAATRAKKNTEHIDRLLALVERTCLQVYREDAQLRDATLDTFEKFCDQPLTRGQDVVSNFAIFCCQLACASREQDVDLSNYSLHMMFELMVEEQARRMLAKSNTQQAIALTDESLCALLGVDANALLAPLVAEFTRAEHERLRNTSSTISSHARKFQMRAGTTAAVLPTAVPKSNAKPANDAPVPDFDIKVTSSPEAKTLAEQFNKCVKNMARNLCDLLLHARSYQPKSGKIVYRSHDAQTSSVWFAVAVQNMQLYSNAKRRAAIEAGTYMCYTDFGINDDAAYNFLHRRAHDCLRTLLAKKKSDVISAMNQSGNDRLGLQFAATDSLDEAAGILLDRTWGASLQSFFRPLQHAGNDWPHVREKLLMFLTGRYRGVLLFADSIKNRNGLPDISPNQDLVWRPSKNNVHKFWMANNHRCDRHTWASLFPHIPQATFDRWYEDFA